MTDTYKMTIDLHVLDQLGIRLYSNIAAILTKAVANAWDADAETADIRIDAEGEWIEVTDDGIGMSVADMNDKPQCVGYRRREEAAGRVTPKGRPVMGQKGLRRPSLFLISDKSELHLTKHGEAHGLWVTVSGSTQRTSK
jgi:HSP90 family molecular chaperone